MMYYDEEGVYFLTAKGKAFYDQLTDEAVISESFGKRAIGIGGDMAKAITDIRGLLA